MPFEAWRVIAERFGRKYGVEVHVGGTKAYSTSKAIVLPGDVQPGMQDTLHALFLHEKEHIIQKDCAFMDLQERVYHSALNVVADIHNDNLVIEQDPGAVGLYKTWLAYVEAKCPHEAYVEQAPWRQKVVMELIQRGWPRELREGLSMTKDPCVKHFFKRHSGRIRTLLKEMKALAQDRDAQLGWAKWLTQELFGDVLEEMKKEEEKAKKNPAGTGDPSQGIPGDPDPNAQPLSKAEVEAILKAIEEMGGLRPNKIDMNNFECIAPGDLYQKVPEAVTVQRLKEFLTEKLEEVCRDEDGGIDPAKLPTYWKDEDDMFQQEVDKKTKRVRVYLLLDCSGSMADAMGDGTRKYEALCRATGLVCQAADRIVRDDGLDIEVEAWAFGATDRMIKTGPEKWDPYEFKKRYWRGGGDGCTRITNLVEHIEEYPDEKQTKSVVVVITDGAFADSGDEAIEKAMAGNKHWLLVGIGEDIPNPKLFRFVASSLDEIEYILTQTVKESVK